MKKATTVTINGQLYDAATGKPIAKAASGSASAPSRPRTFSDIGPSRAVTPTNAAARKVHQRPQRPQTLARQVVQKPTSLTNSQKSPLISRFGQQKPSAPSAKQNAPAPARSTATAAPIAPPPSIINNSAQKPAQLSTKERLIKEGLAKIDSHKPKDGKKLPLLKRKPKLATMLTTSLAILVLGGYFTYVNLPNLSMRVAASRAGIAASFPNYKPDGYSISGAITYSPGEVNINYRSNSDGAGFSLTQKASNWDSQALLDNLVTKKASNYLTYQERGLTVYTYDNKAVWVNGGLLYSLDGDANLSSEQILKFATSL